MTNYRRPNRLRKLIAGAAAALALSGASLAVVGPADAATRHGQTNFTNFAVNGI